MTHIDLENEIRQSVVIVWPGRYRYLKLEKMPPHQRFFLLSQDSEEITAIVEEKDVLATPHSGNVGVFKAFEFRCATPFLAKGFLAKISETIAAKGLNILIVSTFSKDYAFIREEDSLMAIDALRAIGFSVTEAT